MYQRPEPVYGVWEAQNSNIHVIRQRTLQISVHRHIDNPGKWHVTCRELWIDTQELPTDFLEDAKIAALCVCRERAEKIHGEILKLLGELSV